MIRKKIKEILLFFLTVLLFLLIIFLFKIFFFCSNDNQEKEEKYIDPVWVWNYIQEEIISKKENKTEKKEEDFDFSKISAELDRIEKEENSKKIIYKYIPNHISWKSKTLAYKKVFDTFFLSKPINNKIKSLEIVLARDAFEVRWRLRDRKIFIYDLYELSFKESLSVAIHEFWHYLDLYLLKKNVFKDLSDKFYSISWEETNIIKAASKTQDFVSWYAMTNMYEDFAESFNFYVLHNLEFQKRAWKSEKLLKKYKFFRKYVFTDWEFVTDEYSFKIEKDYIWDTTKLDFDLVKFKKYLEKFDKK